MKNNHKKRMSALLSMLLSIVLFIGLIPASAASANEEGTVTIDPDQFDFGVPYAENNITLTAAELFERIFTGDDLVLSDEERAYLDEYLYTLTYNDTLPSDAVQTHYNKDTGVLDVTVPVYAYTAQNGKKASWIPLEVTVGETAMSLAWNGTAYTCSFEGLLDREEDFDIDVTFVQTVNFDEDVIEAFLMQSRTDGAAAEAVIDAYEAEYEAYLQALAAYQAWKEYPSKLAARLEYEAKLEEYLLKKAEYDAYVEEASTYEARRKAYEDYLAAKAEYDAKWADYEQYIEDLAQYEKDYDAYTEYCDQVAAAKARLEVMETLFVTDSHGWQLYASIMGSTVAEVLSRKDELSVLGKDEQVNAASESTEALRVLLKGYADLRKVKNISDHEKYKALHDYYSANYTAIRDNFRKLYEALYNLYSEGAISDYIETQGRGEHFRQFLGQLYITTCCLDDSEAIKMTWTPTTKWKQTLPELVEACQLLYDTVKADPSGKAFPTVEITEPERPETGELPTPPTVVFEPEIPVPVEEPTEPEVVAHPGAQPPKAENPGDPPAKPQLSDTLVAWASAYTDVDYTAREALIGARSLTFETTLTRTVSVDNLLRVRFYSHDGELIGEVQTFVDGDSVMGIVMPEDPERLPTTQYAYEFIGWKRFDGTDLTVDTITTDISLRATYERFLCQYQITWKIDGKIDKTEMWDYGSTPRYDVENKIVGNYDYIFSGWSPEIKTVTENATYEGYYHKILRTHTVTWVLDNGERVETETVAEGKIPSYSGMKDFVKDNAWYRFSNWDKTIVTLTGDVTYTAVYHDAKLLSQDESGQSNINVTVGDDTVTAEMLSPTLDFSDIGDMATLFGVDLVLKRDNVSLIFDADDLKLLKNANCKKIKFTQADETLKNGTSYVLTFYDAQDKTLNTDVTVEVVYRYRSVSDAVAACYQKDGAEWIALESTRQSGVLRAELVGGGTFWVGHEFHILYDPNELCNTSALPERAVAGMWVDFGGVSCVRGYEVTGAVLTLADGTIKEVSGDGFEMPDGTVSISLVVDRIIYHVSFVVDGKVIAEKDYFLGDEVEIPENPTLDKNDGLVYNFIEWSPRVTLVGGDSREIVYTAQFMSSAMITDEEQKAMESNEILIRVLLVLAIVVAVIASIVFAVIFSRKRRRV